MDQTVIKQSKFMLMMKALLAAYITTGLLLLLLAFLLYKFGLGESQVNLGILIIYIVSCFLGGLYLGKRAETRRFLWGMSTGISYALLLTAVTFLTEHQISGDLKETAVMYFLCFLGGALGGMLS